MALEIASPFLALLDEPDYELKAYALQSLNSKVNQLWAELADHLPAIEVLYEDKEFPSPQLAALVASKVYYNLGEYDTSIKFALLAEDSFNLAENTEYTQTIVSKCIRQYIKISQNIHDLPQKELNQLPEEERVIDPRLTEIAERMLQRCVETGDYNLALGVAIEARRLDILDELVKKYTASPDHKDKLTLIRYALDTSVAVVANREFRHRVLRQLIPLVLDLENPDYFAVAKIIVQLNDSDTAIRLFTELLKGDDTNRLIAYQIAFDLVASAPQQLLQSIAAHFSSDEDSTQRKLIKILSGVPTCDFNITFLKKHNNADLFILNQTKDLLDGRNSMFHTAVSLQNAFVHAGTTADRFFRDNLEWLSKATNWTKFSATAALGVIHQGNLSQGHRILQPYLPETQGSCYTQGGSLYALGIIFAGHGREVIDYLRKHVRDAAANGYQNGETEVLLHGGSLGVGVAGMGSGSIETYTELKEVLYSDSAIAGEGSGLAMGLVMVGSKNVEVETEMLQYARDTKHEKIIRSLALGIALLNYGKEEASDDIIEKLLSEQDPILRYGGAYTVALAYAGTGNNRAIKKLLHVAVSDASDDVRRAAVMGIGFIMLRNHTAVPRMVELLSESYNPHVRYGTAMALGISCAGTGNLDAIRILEPMLKDSVDFVRQAAMIALAMVLIQQNEKLSPKVKSIQEHFAKVVGTKHEDGLAKFGATVAQGIIDAGGRNVTISLEYSQTGVLNMRAIVGLAVFTQIWYWFPLAHFLSLAFTPTSIIAIREDLKIPQFQFDSHASLKWFEYPLKISEKESKGPEKLTTAILSTTARAKIIAKKSEAKKKKKLVEEGKMDIEEDEVKPSTSTPKQESGDKMDVETEGGEGSESKQDGKKDEKKTPEPERLDAESLIAEEVANNKHGEKYKVDNLSRVLPVQLKYISFPQDGRFVPVRDFRGNAGGVVLVTDKSPREAVELIKTVRQVHAPDDVDEDEEAPLPQPFNWDPPALE